MLLTIVAPGYTKYVWHVCEQMNERMDLTVLHVGPTGHFPECPLQTKVTNWICWCNWLELKRDWEGKAEGQVHRAARAHRRLNQMCSKGSHEWNWPKTNTCFHFQWPQLTLQLCFPWLILPLLCHLFTSDACWVGSLSGVGRIQKKNLCRGRGEKWLVTGRNTCYSSFP